MRHGDEMRIVRKATSRRRGATVTPVRPTSSARRGPGGDEHVIGGKCVVRPTVTSVRHTQRTPGGVVRVVVFETVLLPWPRVLGRKGR